MAIKELAVILHVKNEKGSTLIEVMVALVILSIGLIGVSKMSYAVINGNVNGSHVSKALNLIQAQVEFFQGQTTLSNTTGFSPSVPIPVNGEGVSGQLDSLYKRDWTITSDVATDIKTVAIRVRWSVGGVAREVTSTTMVRL